MKILRILIVILAFTGIGFMVYAPFFLNHPKLYILASILYGIICGAVYLWCEKLIKH
jgi:hypothetical protein